MFPVGFEPTMSAGEWPQTYALERAATETGDILIYRGADKSLSRPERKQATATEEFEIHTYYL